MNTQKIIRLYILLLQDVVFLQKQIFSLLINEGATKEDLAASIFQAVVNQTISGLAMRKTNQWNTLHFLGGPLTLSAGA